MKSTDRKFEDIFRSFFAFAPIGITISSQDQRIVHANPAAERLVGYGPGEMIGLPLSTFSGPDDTSGESELMTKMLGGELSSYVVEKQFVRKDGERRWVRITASTMPGDEPGTFYRLAAAEDIHDFKETQRKLAEHQQALMAAAKMTALGYLAGGISHEIKSPLSVIYLSALQIIQKQPATTEVGSAAEMIMRNSKRIEKILDGLRDLSRDTSNAAFEMTKVSTIVEDTLTFCKGRIRKKGIRLGTEVLPFDMELECRPFQVGEVLLNLLNNACDSIENREDSWISLEARIEGDCALLSVTDSGPPIEADTVSRMFDPFFSTKSPGKTAGTGMGLGLSISRRIAEGHDGELLFDETKPNPRFVLKLPLRQATLRNR